MSLGCNSPDRSIARRTLHYSNASAYRVLVGYNGRGNRNHSQMQFRAELGRFAAEFAAFAVGRAGGAGRLGFDATTAEPDSRSIAPHRVFLVGREVGGFEEVDVVGIHFVFGFVGRLIASFVHLYNGAYSRYTRLGFLNNRMTLLYRILKHKIVSALT